MNFLLLLASFVLTQDTYDLLDTLPNPAGASPLDKPTAKIIMLQPNEMPHRWSACMNQDTDWCCMNQLWLRFVPVWLQSTILPRFFLSHDAMAVPGLDYNGNEAVLFNCSAVIRIYEFREAFMREHLTLVQEDQKAFEIEYMWDQVKVLDGDKSIGLEWGVQELACQRPPWQRKIEQIPGRFMINRANKVVRDHRGVCIPDEAALKDKAERSGKSVKQLKREAELFQARIEAAGDAMHQHIRTNPEVATYRPDANFMVPDLRYAFAAYLTTDQSN